MSDDDQVKLKPVFGMQPGKYLVILYSVIIAAIIFIVFFLPGLKNPGSLVSFDGVPDESVILVDGKYKGAAPCEIFIPEGEHLLEIQKEYFDTYSESILIEGRLFASLIFPKKINKSYKLVLNDPDGLMSKSFSDFAEWGMIDSYFDNYQPKPVLESLFNNLQNSGYSDTASLSGFLYSIIPFVHNEILYKDFFNAVVIFEEIRSGEEINENYSIADGFTKIKFFSDSSRFMENLPFWFYSLLSDESRENNIEWYPALQEEYGAFLRDFSNDYPATKAAVTIEGMRFIMLEGGQFLSGADGTSFPYPAVVEDLMVMDREVTNQMYAVFLAENSIWRTGNIDNLIENGSADKNYLKDFTVSSPDEPVNFISWYAADAFCKWLQNKLPEYLADYEVRLPDEHEWEWIALTDSDNSGIFNSSSDSGPLSAIGRYPNNTGFYDLKGNLWEWCDNWYAPTAPLITSRNPVYNEPYYGVYDGIEKSVRGGSWANEDSISISSRGSQPPSWCTEFLGFRPVLVKN